ncbi:hypothetical protein [Pseudodesulfovibrio indicus]|uniref:hypothetical protein n=1 Tax=Pseudodesulfovibrio indicus TaxID=1716143 RepID=UPI00106427D5|nr:hypothetical protein [Pseudodesulfovibrio indicus]
MENKSRDDESPSVVARRNDQWVNASNWGMGASLGFPKHPRNIFCIKTQTALDEPIPLAYIETHDSRKNKQLGALKMSIGTLEARSEIVCRASISGQD